MSDHKMSERVKIAHCGRRFYVARLTHATFHFHPLSVCIMHVSYPLSENVEFVSIMATSIIDGNWSKFN